MIKKLLIILLVFSCGCSAAKHMDELLTLKEISKEQEGMGEYVEKQDKKFKVMLDAYNTERWSAYFDQETILNNFGDPVFTRKEIINDKVVETWVYRYAMKYFDSPKIYLYFDESGSLTDSKLIPARTKE